MRDSLGVTDERTLLLDGSQGLMSIEAGLGSELLQAEHEYSEIPAAADPHGGIRVGVMTAPGGP